MREKYSKGYRRATDFADGYADSFVAGYLAALQTKTDKVQGLLKALEEIQGEAQFEDGDMDKIMDITCNAFMAYQTDEGEGV